MIGSRNLSFDNLFHRKDQNFVIYMSSSTSGHLEDIGADDSGNFLRGVKTLSGNNGQIGDDRLGIES